MSQEKEDLSVAPGHVLVLRNCGPTGESRNGFVWPESGPVQCPDWRADRECGHGLHGWLWGEGDSGAAQWTGESRWLVVSVLESEIVHLGGKVKFPRGEVVHCGDVTSATRYLGDRCSGKRIICGTATAGECGVLSLLWCDGKRFRRAIFAVGEDGVEPNVEYRLDDKGQLVKAVQS